MKCVITVTDISWKISCTKPTGKVAAMAAAVAVAAACEAMACEAALACETAAAAEDVMVTVAAAAFVKENPENQEDQPN